MDDLFHFCIVCKEDIFISSRGTKDFIATMDSCNNHLIVPRELKPFVVNLESKHYRNILLLNSAHGKYPRGGDPWAQATAKAMESLAGKGFRLIASVGLPSWELSAFLGGRMGFELVLIVPGREDEEGQDFFSGALRSLGLERAKVQPVFAGHMDEKEFFSARDWLAFELADIVCPISVRPGGRLDLLSAEFSNSGKEFHDDFRVKWSRVSWSPKYRFPMDEINPELRVFEQGWLTHWTHTWPGPWPSEQAWEFYRDMLAEPETYVRDARATLSRIISEGLLRASSWKMPAEEPAVGFTALAPAEALGLMRWRKRYTRYSFEPFGLALRLEPLERLGARPVRYLKPDETARLGTGKIDKLFTQSAGRKGNWAAEREWRCRGDLPLGSFTKEELVLFAADSETAETIKAGLKQAWEVIPLFI